MMMVIAICQMCILAYGLSLIVYQLTRIANALATKAKDEHP